MSDETTRLKEENERFKAIIDILLKENKQLSTQLSLLTGNDGNIQSTSSNDLINEGNIEINTSNDVLLGGKGERTYSNHALNDRKADINTSQLAGYLRKEMLKSNFAGLKNAAKLLAHFYNQPRNTHKHLANLTNMTLSGLAKHIYMLKKRGLIVRNGFQTYMLTPKATGIIEKAMQPPPAGETASTPT